MNTQTIEDKTGNIDFTVHGNAVCFLGQYGSQRYFDTPFQRTKSRQKTLGLMSIVFDGRAQYFCTVDELSSNGLRLGQVPADFEESGAVEYTAMVLTPYNNVHLVLKLRWLKETNKGMYKSVGFEIMTPPREWQDFVFNLKTGKGDLFFLLSEDEMRGIQ